MANGSGKPQMTDGSGEPHRDWHEVREIAEAYSIAASKYAEMGDVDRAWTLVIASIRRRVEAQALFVDAMMRGRR